MSIAGVASAARAWLEYSTGGVNECAVLIGCIQILRTAFRDQSIPTGTGFLCNSDARLVVPGAAEAGCCGAFDHPPKRRRASLFFSDALLGVLSDTAREVEYQRGADADAASDRRMDI